MNSVSHLPSSNPAPVTSQTNAHATSGRTSTGQQQLSKQELELIAELKRRDREVRAHEQAHLAAAGQYATGGVQYTFQKGPDGKNYAVGGEVSIDTSPVPGNPEATLRKAEQIRRAANAPASPSSRDRSVAADATAIAMQAKVELSRQNQQTDAVPNESRLTSKLVNNDLLSMAYNADSGQKNLLDMLI